MTLRELKEKIPFQRMPGQTRFTAKRLRESKIPVVADTEQSMASSLGPDIRAWVYQNGLILYRNGTNGGDRSTVFSLHGRYPECDMGDPKTYEELPYQYWILLIGEFRLEHNEQVSETRNHVSLEWLAEDFELEPAAKKGDPLKMLTQQESVRFVFSLLTDRQKEVVWMYFFEQMRQEDIAARLGIKRVTVATILRTALQNIRSKWDDDLNLKI